MLPKHAALYHFGPVLGTLARFSLRVYTPPVSSPQDLIGASRKRKEDHRLLTGAGRYVDDLSRPGLVHMAVVKSRHAHGRIMCGL